jgi:hypothetical protein
MYHETVKIKLRCPKHPRYNPTQGEGAIRGACGECLALFSLMKGVAALRTIKAMDGEMLEGEFHVKSSQN